MKNRRTISAQDLGVLKATFGTYKGSIVTLILIGLLAGVLEGIGINSIIPLFSIATNPLNEAPDTVTALMKNLFGALNIPFTVTALLIFMVILFFGKACLMILFSFIRNRIIEKFENKTRKEIFEKTLGANWLTISNIKSGYLEKTLVFDVTYAGFVLGYMADVLIIVSTVTVYTLLALSISAPTTILALVSGLIIMLGLRPLVKRIKRLAKTEEKQMKDLAAFTNESHYGLKQLKSLAVDEKVAKLGENKFEQFKKNQSNRIILSDFNIYLIQPLGVILVALIFTYFISTGQFNFSIIAVVIYLIQKIFTHTQSLQNKLHNIYSNLPFVENINNFTDELNKNKEDINNDEKIVEFNEKIEFENVNFDYEGRDKLLVDLNLIIKKNTAIGISGKSGSGKTTLVDLLLGLYFPTQGKILIDQQNIKEINLKKWREKIGYVSQDDFLLNDSIFNNIKFYFEASDEEVYEAAKKASLHDFVMALPEKYNTLVGNQGIKLSGGQKQRISIARNILRKPMVLILDEATNALDQETTNQINETIQKLKNNLTIIVISHQLAELNTLDMIYELKDGKLQIINTN